MNRKFIVIMLIGIITAIYGCASIITGTYQEMSVSSEPSTAKVIITDKSNFIVFDGVTPAKVRLKKGAGYFEGNEFTVKISKDGYEERRFTLETRLNGWYIFGNLLIGGLIGWVIIDPITGGMWKIEPEKIESMLVQNVSLGDGSQVLHIVLLDAVPDTLKPAMVRIN